MILPLLMAAAPALAGDSAPLATLPLEALVASSEPVLLSGAPVASCEEAPLSLDTVIDTTDRAARAVSYLDAELAGRELDAAEAQLLCVNGPIAANVAARIAFLRGVLAYNVGDSDSASAWFRQALVIRPSLPWDDDFPPEPMLLFEAERTRLGGAAPASLEVLPNPRVVQLWVDGQPRHEEDDAVELAPGTHYLQLGSDDWRVLRIDVASGSEETLLLASQLPTDLGPWLEDPVLGPALLEVVGARVEPGVDLQLDVDGQAWTATSGSGGWSRVPPPPVQRQTVLPRVVAVTGISTAIAGGVLALGGSRIQALANEDAQAATTWGDVREAQGRHATGVEQTSLGQLLLASGLVVGTAGVVWTWRVPTRTVSTEGADR